MIAHDGIPDAGKLRSLPVDWLERGRLQPRRIIDGAKLKRLADSIRAQGLIQPIFVRKKRRGKFEIIAGERRWHAARIAGLKHIPSVIRNVSDASALAIALIENLHREDLNPIDQATAVSCLVREFGMTHQEVAETIGRSRTAVSNLIRLLELPEPVRDMVAEGDLEMGHARAILALPEAEREARARFVADRHLTVRDVEAMGKRARELSTASSRKGDIHESAAQSVVIRRGRNGRFSVRFAFESADDLEKAIMELRAYARAYFGRVSSQE